MSASRQCTCVTFRWNQVPQERRWCLMPSRSCSDQFSSGRALDSGSFQGPAWFKALELNPSFPVCAHPYLEWYNSVQDRSSIYTVYCDFEVVFFICTHILLFFCNTYLLHFNLCEFTDLFPCFYAFYWVLWNLRMDICMEKHQTFVWRSFIYINEAHK